jgi:iron complex transport system ATP-binding protein
MLNVESVAYGYGREPLFSDVSFEAAPGTVLGILGPNGAGKSTLLRLLGGRFRPRSGRVCVDGRPVRDLAPEPRARLVAMVPQNPAAHFGFTVEELVAMGRRPYVGLLGRFGQDDRTAVEEALAAAGLSGLRGRSLTRLSGGETQLAFVARALAQQPRLLLLDEATSNLDIRHVAAILSVLRRRVSERGLAVVAVMHDVNLALGFCDRIAFLSDGRLTGPGIPRELVTADVLARVYGVASDTLRVHPDPFHVQVRWEAPA